MTRPTTVARTSHRSQSRTTSSSAVGLDDGQHALLALGGHHLEGLHARLRGGARPPRRRPCPCRRVEAVSLVAQVSPAPPRSWMPTTRPASSSTRHASISRFSSKGSPTWTLGRLASSPVAEAGRRQHADAADPVAARRRAQQHRQVALAVGLAEHETVGRAGARGTARSPAGCPRRCGRRPPRRRRWARPRRCRSREMPLTTPSAIQRLRASSSGPNRSGSMRAMGRAPMVKMSRRMPPTPVAAPWNGSMADGWLWLSMRIAAAIPSPTSTTPAFSPGPTSTQGASVGRRRRCRRDDL